MWNSHPVGTLVLGAIDAQDQLELLVYLTTSDANADVRSQAERALRKLRGEPEPEAKPIFGTTAGEVDTAVDGDADDDHKKPALTKNVPDEETRVFAFGMGTMGGFGLAAINFRGRIPTGAKGLPWIGIELGGGWTPPQVYGITSGYTGTMTEDPVRWQIISGALGVQFYLHRSHYIPLRGGFNMGQGPYGLLGYGYEHLNAEGFFSFGVEIGILVQPGAKTWNDNFAADNDQPEPWPVVPFARFVLHFYMV